MKTDNYEICGEKIYYTRHITIDMETGDKTTVNVPKEHTCNIPKYTPEEKVKVLKEVLTEAVADLLNEGISFDYYKNKLTRIGELDIFNKALEIVYPG